MKRQQVESSNLASVGYRAEEATLEVEFRNGRVYRYFGVPERVVWELLRAESKGKTFNRRIRNAYAFERAS